MIRILFWNVNKQNLTTHVCSIASGTQSDVIILNENVIPSSRTLRSLRSSVTKDFFIPQTISEDRFHCFCRTTSLDLIELHHGFRLSVRRLKVKEHDLLLAIVHGVDVRNYDAANRQSFAQSLASEIEFAKQEHKTNKVVVLGDFNMNPYDPGMNLAAGLNAMMTKRCVANGVRRHLGHNYDLYYNPMWSHFGDITLGPAGTVYDTSSQGAYGWSMFDQALIHHSLVNIFERVDIIDNAGNVSLADSNGRPNNTIASDHFPILLTLREE